MPHFRNRFAIPIIDKLAKLWPVIGIIGLRQSGKTTLMKNILGIEHITTFDDIAVREEAIRSPKTFLEKLNHPVVLDEVQKAPPIFDEIKLRVDQQRVPGSYYITGSTSFSNKIGIGESLTGRIGLIELFPMSLAELNNKEFRKITHLSEPIIQHQFKPRFESAVLSRAATLGGMPIPAFLRESDQRELYWRSWLDTTIHRDLARFFQRGFDPDFAFSILERIATTLRNAELPTLKHFSGSARKTRNYLNAMEEIFLLRKIKCHPQGLGKEIWLLKDSGLAAYLMGSVLGEENTLSLVRHFIWNEIDIQAEYQGKRLLRQYYKSGQGSPIDLIINDIPFRIVPNVTSITQRLSWEERPLIGAMKKLDSKFGYLIAPIDKAELPPRKGGIGILPWTTWS